MHAQWNGAGRSDLDQVVALDVVNLDMPVEAPRELG